MGLHSFPIHTTCLSLVLCGVHSSQHIGEAVICKWHMVLALNMSKVFPFGSFIEFAPYRKSVTMGSDEA